MIKRRDAEFPSYPLAAAYLLGLCVFGVLVSVMWEAWCGR